MTPTDADAERIARRYPRTRAPGWLWIPLAAALAALLVGWTSWAGWQAAHPDAAGRIAGFKVVSDTRIDVEVTVQRSDVRSRVQCQVKALAISYDTVGEVPFTWEPNGQELQQDWVTVRTFKRAVAADLDYCKVVP